MNREKELVVINKVLAGLVVVLALLSGYLLASQESWLKNEEVAMPTQETKMVLPDFNGILIDQPKQSALADLLKTARYSLEKPTIFATVDKKVINNLVWAAQGEITEWGERAAYSYKAKFPLKLYVWINRTEESNSGWYVYQAEGQQLIPSDESIPKPVDADLLVVAVAKDKQVVTSNEMIWFEAGEVAQNILLMSKEMDLAASISMIPDSQFLWTISLGGEQK